MRRKMRSFDATMEALEQRQLMSADFGPHAYFPGYAASAGAAVVADRFGNVGGEQDVALQASIGGSDVEFTLDGPGAGRLLQVNGRYIVNLTGTTDESKLSIKSQGDGATPVLNNINVSRSIGEITIEGVNMRGRILVSGSLEKLEAENLRAGGIIIRGDDFDTEMKLGNVFNSRIETAGGIKSLEVTSWNDTNTTKDRIDAAWVEEVKSDGDFGASLVLSGTDDDGRSLKELSVNGAFNGGVIAAGDVQKIEVDSMTGARILVSGDLGEVKVEGDVLSTNIAAANLEKFEVKDDVRNSHIAVGASFGTATAGQIFDRTRGLVRIDGSIGEIKIEGDVARSTFTAGVRPVDGVWLNGNDRFVVGADGEIEKIEVKGSFITSTFAAPNLPEDAKIDDDTVSTEGDPRFLTTLA